MSVAHARLGHMSYTCTECGYSSIKWLGRCSRCGEWGTLEQSEAAGGATAIKTQAKEVPASKLAKPITEVDGTRTRAFRTGVSELDRVLGGGVVPGAVILLAGEPGVGKSTLLLDVAGRASRESGEGRRALYITGEESAGQVRLRAERIGAMHPDLLLAAESDLATVLGMIVEIQPELLIIDSVQTLASAEVQGVPGGVTQVREVAAAIIRAAKSLDVPTVLVGHITKDGTVAGPRLLEHLVDVVCEFEGDKHSRLRLLRAVKNRYGPTDEVGCFDMTELGIQSVPDPTGLFLSRGSGHAPGSCLTVVQEGKRHLLVEIQTLVDKQTKGAPRRTVSGLDANRLAMTLAVLNSEPMLHSFAECDVYASTVGGAKVVEPAADLALALALESAWQFRPLENRVIGIGELRLSGEIRNVPGIEQRLEEAYRQGVSHAIVAAGGLNNVTVPRGMEVSECDSIRQAVEAAMGLELNNTAR